MKNAEAALILACASGVDNRKHGEAQAKMWARILGDIDLQDALAAVERHYSTSETFLMPVHVIEGARRIRDERVGRERVAALEAKIAAENPGVITERDVPAIEARRVPVDDEVRAERRRMLRAAAYTKKTAVEEESAVRNAYHEGMQAARAELERVRAAQAEAAVEKADL